MAQYGSGPQRGPMGQTLMGGLNNVGQRSIPGNAGLSQAALQRQAGAGVNLGALGGASGAPAQLVICNRIDMYRWNATWCLFIIQLQCSAALVWAPLTVPCVFHAVLV